MREDQLENDRLTDALASFDATTANVLIDGLTTGVFIRYSYNPEAVEIRGLPELPPLLRFDSGGKVAALLRGELHHLPEEAAKAFNIYRLLDPRVVKRGLISPSRYDESSYSFVADLDVGIVQSKAEFALSDELQGWLKDKGLSRQPIEFIVEVSVLRQMTFFELPPARQRLSVVFR